MRADRLIRVLFVLQSRESVTAAQLAVELETSVATARRDLEALSMSGVPVYPQPGRGGGWRLLGGARTNLTGLTESESTALFALLGKAQGGAREAASAIQKLLAALPATFRHNAQRAIGSTLDDGAAWGDAPTSTPAEVSTLQRAISHERAIHLGYRAHPASAATPLGVATRGGHWYLLADPGAGPRMYRVDRIRDLSILDSDAPPRPGFDLSRAWADAVAAVESLRGASSAEVLVDDDAVAAFVRRFGRQASVQDAVGNGRVRVEARAQSTEALAEQLAGWAAVIEVVGPSEVRRALADLGRRLVNRYG
ncbi:helix-turn-helix transcriptional regulator [Paramicrobacterium agarici]|uniref:helix-turn-helix transcriptional regulator n=1 Tax=Paramicrobacterium agarici TaxID=630514 RepID=UPI001150671D|nr:WYL domain-containing protein [Microbacterium agarici]TQO22546.1 putative DNA-binding transcriptional regulator YafY [Microbacterium agarici]